MVGNTYRSVSTNRAGCFSKPPPSTARLFPRSCRDDLFATDDSSRQLGASFRRSSGALDRGRDFLACQTPVALFAGRSRSQASATPGPSPTGIIFSSFAGTWESNWLTINSSDNVVRGGAISPDG